MEFATARVFYRSSLYDCAKIDRMSSGDGGYEAAGAEAYCDRRGIFGSTKSVGARRGILHSEVPILIY